MSKKEIKLQLIPPTEQAISTVMPVYDDEQLKDYGFEDREHLADTMFQHMTKFGGVGLSANQVGLNLRMFVMGGHPQIENGKRLNVFNPVIIQKSDEEVLMQEGCLSFPFVFLKKKRARKVTIKFEDEKGDLMEASLDGVFSRIFQHELEHMEGKTFIDGVSKIKLDRAYKKAEKLIDKVNKLKKKSLS
jgi:peptide deformylase